MLACYVRKFMMVSGVMRGLGGPLDSFLSRHGLSDRDSLDRLTYRPGGSCCYENGMRIGKYNKA